MMSTTQARKRRAAIVEVFEDPFARDVALGRLFADVLEAIASGACKRPRMVARAALGLPVRTAGEVLERLAGGKKSTGR